MQKLVLLLGLMAFFAYTSAVDCPPDDENGTATYFPHETECGKFYECHNGEAALLDCAPGSYWDPRLNVCSSEVDCGNLLTSQAPSTTVTEAAFA